MMSGRRVAMTVVQIAQNETFVRFAHPKSTPEFGRTFLRFGFRVDRALVTAL